MDVNADDKVRPIRGKAHRHARVLRFSGADEHAVILDQLPPVLQQREKAVLIQEELDPVAVFGMNETVGVALGIDEEILALFQDLTREGVTLVLVTPDAEVARHARRVVRFRDGHVIADVRQEPADARAALAAHDSAAPMPEAAE